MSIDSTVPVDKRCRWPWLILILGLVWTVVIRVPLILNAEDHLDSDLAVDGLTLGDAVHGQWRWHYPGTPHMGILPVLASYAQSLIWGVNSVTLVSGGTVLWLTIVIATFWLAAAAFSLRVAAFAIVPLVFSTIGTIWLSGRITGGHLITLFWHVAALVGVRAVIACGGAARAAGLGIWCGVGLYLDAMFLMTFPGIAAAVAMAWGPGNRPKGIGIGSLMFILGLVLGVSPLELGRRFDPYDCYSSQFAATSDAAAIASHGRLLLFHCLPRLVAGTELGQLERSIPWDRLGASRPRSMAGASLSEWFAAAMLLGFAIAVIRLGLEVSFSRADPVRRGVSLGVLVSALLVAAAFLVNRGHFNSDNYRYLIYLLVPWTLGFGLVIDDLTRHRGWSCGLGIVLLGVFGWSMSATTFAWYRDTRQYVNVYGMPIIRMRAEPGELTIQPDEPAPGTFAPPRPWKYDIPADVTHVFGGYWDVYRLSFLSGGKIVGIPFPMYPNRFQGWSRGLGEGNGKLLVLRPGEGATSASRPASETRGDRIRMVRSAKRVDWRPAFTTVWELDGRDPTELDRLNVAVP